jgi:hypothetical protein
VTRLSSRNGVIALLAVSAIGGFAASADAATGLALLAIATIPALYAVPPRGRPVLGVVVAGTGLMTTALGDLDGGAAAWMSSVALVAAGVIITLWGSRWSRLARRYDDEVTDQRAGEPVDLWRALDRGEDPTDGDSPGADGGNRSPHRD